MIIPAQEPNAGRPAPISLRSGSRTSKATDRRHRVVDSPPGITRPSTLSSSSGQRTGTGLAPAAASARRCSGTSPCRASTPITGAVTIPPSPGRGGFGTSESSWVITPRIGGVSTHDNGRRGLPAAGGEVVGGWEGVQVDADHGLAEAAGDLGDHVRVIVEGGGLDDGGGPPAGIA